MPVDPLGSEFLSEGYLRLDCVHERVESELEHCLTTGP